MASIARAYSGERDRNTHIAVIAILIDARNLVDALGEDVVMGMGDVNRMPFINM